jgi:hypothetical protein
LPGALDRLVHSPTLGIPPASLHIALEQVVIDGVEHDLRHLCPGCIVEEDEFRFSVQGRKGGTNGFNRKVGSFAGILDA